MSEQQGQTEVACQHPDAVGTRWGDPISDERRQELAAVLAAWNAPDADRGDRMGPFHGVELTGADAFWLVQQAGPDANGLVPNLHLEGASLVHAHLETLYRDVKGLAWGGAFGRRYKTSHKLYEPG